MADLPNLTITTILDRCHAIHQIAAFSGIHAVRYFPSSLANANTPLLVPIYARGQHNNNTYGPENFVRQRAFTLILFAGHMLEGYPTQSASVAMETYIEVVLAEYAKRPRLQLTGGSDPLGGIVEDCSITNDQATPDNETGFLIVQFTLIVPAIHTITRY